MLKILSKIKKIFSDIEYEWCNLEPYNQWAVLMLIFLCIISIATLPLIW